MSKLSNASTVSSAPYVTWRSVIACVGQLETLELPAELVHLQLVQTVEYLVVEPLNGRQNQVTVALAFGVVLAPLEVSHESLPCRESDLAGGDPFDCHVCLRILLQASGAIVQDNRVARSARPG